MNGIKERLEVVVAIGPLFNDIQPDVDFTDRKQKRFLHGVLWLLEEKDRGLNLFCHKVKYFFVLVKVKKGAFYLAFPPPYSNFAVRKWPNAFSQFQLDALLRHIFYPKVLYNFCKMGLFSKIFKKKATAQWRKRLI